jgi:hypothetical protein
MIQTAILLSDPDISAAELAAVGAVLGSPRLSGGPVVTEFESAFAQYTNRKQRSKPTASGSRPRRIACRCICNAATSIWDFAAATASWRKRYPTAPFHGHLDEDQIAFVVGTLKDASTNVGAGSAIF